MTSALIRRAAVPGVAAAIAFAVAYDNGGYALADRTTIAIVAWWSVLLLLAFGLWPRQPLGHAATATGAFLAVLASWTLLSATWAPSAEHAFAEFNRVTLYLGVFVLAVAVGTAGRAGPVANGVAIGIVAIAAVAIASWLFPTAFSLRGVPEFLPGARERLSFPVGYWNGLAVLVALAWPLVLNLATSRDTKVRAAAVAVTPLFGAVAYLTASRGGIAAAAVGTAVYLVLSDRRRLALAALVVAVAGGVAGASIARLRSDFVGANATTAVLLVIVGGATAGFWILGSRFVRARLATRPVAFVATAILLIGAVAAVTASATAPGTAAAPGASADRVPGSRGTSGRIDFWTAAVDQFLEHPIVGDGAGSYEAWWTRHGGLAVYTRNAHSLYLETLGELGFVGIALLAAAIGVALVAAFRFTRAARDGTAAALLGAAAAFLVSAAFDWMWELTVVAVVGIGALGLLLGLAHREERGYMTVRAVGTGRLGLGVAVLLAAWAIGCSQTLELLADLQVRASQTAARRGDGEDAFSRALAARKLAPWAATPRLQLALVAEQSGDLPEARKQIGEAVERASEDWRLWLAAARIETKAGDVRDAQRSLAEVERLNPRFALFEGS